MKARQILMLVEIKSKFTIYDVYNVDNRLPLHIFAISATYTIVLLQIANLWSWLTEIFFCMFFVSNTSVRACLPTIIYIKLLKVISVEELFT